MSLRPLCLVVLCVPLLLPAAADAQGRDPLAGVAAALPAEAAGFTAARIDALERAADRAGEAFAELALFRGLTTHQQGLERVNLLLGLKGRTDRLLARTLALRDDFAALPTGEPRRDSIRNYLRATSKLIDLSGRMRYALYDVVTGAMIRVLAEPVYFDRLVDLLIQHRSAVGALIASDGLFELQPPEQSKSSKESETAPGLFRRRGQALRQRREERSPPPDIDAIKHKVLRLIAETGNLDALPALVEYLNEPGTSPELALAAAQTIRRIGLPQPLRPGHDPTLPEPPITAGSLREIVSKIDPQRLSPASRGARDELLAWLAGREKRGLEGDEYRLGDFTVRPGDWLLMRNPSPYNRFTDLAPGLFTHVGVITTESANDGVRRMVLIDIPERGDHMQATPIDTFVLRTLHYVVLRHEDPAVAKQMADVARAVIGNPSQFDLNFRTDRVAALKGQPLEDRKIHTYCAGLLLLCAQETDAPRSDFFPIPEYPAGGKTQENLAQLGLTFGDNFISPTGALFSPHLKIVGRRESMYDPAREAEEAVYDHFAKSLIDRTLTPSPDLFQSLRTKLAEAGEENPLIAQALADAAGVNRETDLVAAARTAAVVEALDEIARRASAGFLNARRALLAGPEKTLPERGYSSADIAAIRAYRERHADLYRQLIASRLTPRQLRIGLLNYYIPKGKRELDARFFHDSSGKGNR
jgi:hypothetical protein